jgi:gas vesicle protein
MPTDPVYNPQLPSASMASSRSSDLSSTSPWSDSVSTPDASSWSALSAGLVAGAVAGAALALMYAPMRGSEVRRSIRRYASDGSQRLSQIVENGRSMAGGAIERAASLMEQGRSAFRTAGTSGPSHRPSQPLTASVAEISGVDRRFEEPLGG